MMNKVVSELKIENYKVLVIDEKYSDITYNKYRIDGKEYTPVPIYDAPNCIAIESDDTFEGKIVEFIKD